MSIRNSVWGFVFVGWIAISPAQESASLTVAVLNFQGYGIAAGEAKTLTDRFAAELNRTGKVKLVERNAMEDILREQGFQQSGCTTNECAAEVGALLGVEQIMAGSIGKVGRTYTVDIRQVSVATGETHKSVSSTYTGAVDGLIYEVEDLAREMVSVEPRESSGKSVVQKPSKSITQDSELSPAGAMMRSAIIPGWGQVYAKKPVLGFIWFGATAYSVSEIISSQDKYTSAEDDYNKYYSRWRNEDDDEDHQDYRDKMDRYQAEMDAAQQDQRVFAGVTIGLWAANCLHAYFTAGGGSMMGMHSMPPRKLYLTLQPFNQQVKLYWTLNK